MPVVGFAERAVQQVGFGSPLGKHHHIRLNVRVSPFIGYYYSHVRYYYLSSFAGATTLLGRAFLHSSHQNIRFLNIQNSTVKYQPVR
jgi:hypothetical protein